MTERIFLSPRAKATVLWIAAALILLFLWQVRAILTPFLWAIVTAYVLNPVVVFLARRTRMPRRVWSIVFYLVLLGLLIWGLTTLVPLLSQQLSDFARELPRNFREAGKLLGQSEIDLLGVTINLNAPDEEISRQITLLAQQLGREALPGALPHLAESLLHLLVYLVSTFFLLLEADRIGDFIYRYTPPAARTELGPWLRRINHVLGAYIRGQLILVVLMTVVTYIALTLLGVRFAPLLAIFTGLVETMPFIGPYIAAGTSILVALTQGYAPFGWTPIILAVAVAIAYTILRQLEDNFVMPFLIGRLVHLHPLIVIFAVLSGAAIGGILGLLIAVPVAATLKIVITYLYGKFREEPPRTVAIIDDDDDWDSIIMRIRRAAGISKAEGAPHPRILISVPDPPAALMDPVRFHRLPALLAELRADAVLITSDETLTRMAADAGIATEQDIEWQGIKPPDPDYAESDTQNLLRRRKRVAS